MTCDASTDVLRRAAGVSLGRLSSGRRGNGAEAKGSDGSDTDNHVCDPDVVATFGVGLTGLDFEPAPKGAGWSVVIGECRRTLSRVVVSRRVSSRAILVSSRVAMRRLISCHVTGSHCAAAVESSRNGPRLLAEEFNNSVRRRRCCGLLRKDLLLVSINDEQLQGVEYSRVMRMLATAERPVTLRFRETSVSAMSRMHHELQCRCVGYSLAPRWASCVVRPVTVAW